MLGPAPSLSRLPAPFPNRNMKIFDQSHPGQIKIRPTLPSPYLLLPALAISLHRSCAWNRPRSVSQRRQLKQPGSMRTWRRSSKTRSHSLSCLRIIITSLSVRATSWEMAIAAGQRWRRISRPCQPQRCASRTDIHILVECVLDLFAKGLVWTCRAGWCCKCGWG